MIDINEKYKAVIESDPSLKLDLEANRDKIKRILELREQKMP